MGAMLQVNPILGIKNGEAFPYTRVRSRSKAVKALHQFALTFKDARAIAVEYGTNIDEAKIFAGKIISSCAKVPVYISHVSPVIGAHTGPGVLSISVLEG